ncbi:MAG: hypothetical protein K5910_05355 [Bacteroidales bacterium]|nr:hypothetical protein [Bacteroidales bacterium]
MSKFRKYGTCFFEKYAQIELSTLLGREYDDLVDRDRPDLQSPDSLRLGIEVTRAMEESRKAATQLLKGVSGIAPVAERKEMERIMETGYAYGLNDGRYVGAKELEYWSLALPLRKILKSKVAKMGNGFYGDFTQSGLFVFCKDNLSEEEAARTCQYVLHLQREQEKRYNRLYLADIDELFVCNLDDGLSFDSRLTALPVTQAQRQSFYLEAVRQQLEA